jgi:YggT family protein
MHNGVMFAPVLNPFSSLILMVLSLCCWVVWGRFILTWLISFNIVNRYQPVVQKINYALTRLTEPLLRPIRKYMPDLGIDLSPVVLLLAIYFIESAVLYYSLPH